MNIRPLHDHIIVKRKEQQQTSPGGIVIPEQAAEKPIRGEVIAVGNGKKLDSGKVQELSVKKGDEILFGKYAGTEVKLEGEDFLVMRESDILAVLEQ
ncbi:MAG: co-chaperone GroES [Candidatus Competibacterales bacterium]